MSDEFVTVGELKMVASFGIGRGINKVLGIWGLMLLRKRSYGPYVIDIWKFSDEFEEIYAKIKSTVGVTKRSLFIVYQVLPQVSSIVGGVAECGVYKGGSAYLVAEVVNKLAPEKTIHLFDTFKGLPDPNVKYDSFYKKGLFQDTSVESVKAFLREFNNCKIYEGLFREKFASVTDETFCFVHVDSDLYDSIFICCEFFYPRLSPGGIMIFDDYGYTINWPGAKLAVEKFFSDKKEKPIHLPTGQCMVIKI